MTVSWYCCVIDNNIYNVHFYNIFYLWSEWSKLSVIKILNKIFTINFCSIITVLYSLTTFDFWWRSNVGLSTYLHRLIVTVLNPYNQCLSPFKLWVQIPLMVKCTG